MKISLFEIEAHERAAFDRLRSAHTLRICAELGVLPDEPAIREEAQLVSSIFADRSSVDLRGVVADHLLLRLPNVVVTPHSGFNTREALARIVDTTLDNIEAFIAGRPLNRVMPSRTS